jgi:hypothetical protein
MIDKLTEITDDSVIVDGETVGEVLAAKPAQPALYDCYYSEAESAYYIFNGTGFANLGDGGEQWVRYAE